MKDSNCFSLEFTLLNRKDCHSLDLHTGDVLFVDFAIDSGRADLQIGIDGKAPIYTGNDIYSGVFELTAPEDGAYNISVKARHASGFIMVNAVRDAGKAILSEK